MSSPKITLLGSAGFNSVYPYTGEPSCTHGCIEFCDKKLPSLGLVTIQNLVDLSHRVGVCVGNPEEFCGAGPPWEGARG